MYSFNSFLFLFYTPYSPFKYFVLFLLKLEASRTLSMYVYGLRIVLCTMPKEKVNIQRINMNRLDSLPFSLSSPFSLISAF